MFDELSNIFERNFLVAHTLPATLFSVATIIGLVTAEVMDISVLTNWLADYALTGLAAFTLWILLFSVVLSALNKTLFRVMSGVGKFNLFRLTHWIERRRFKNLLDERETLDTKFFINDYSVSSASREKDELDYSNVSKILAKHYPANLENVHPTSVGNIIAAFEVYPRALYGFDGAVGWMRISPLISKEHHRIISNYRADTSLWMNTWLLGIVFAVIWLGIALVDGQFRETTDILNLLLATLVFSFAWTRTKAAAIEWGESVKASYDIYLPKLASELPYKFPESARDRRAFWEAFSIAILDRDATALNDLHHPNDLASKRLIYVDGDSEYTDRNHISSKGSSPSSDIS